MTPPPSPLPPDHLLEQAHLALIRGDLAQAHTLLERLVLAEPDNQPAQDLWATVIARQAAITEAARLQAGEYAQTLPQPQAGSFWTRPFPLLGSSWQGTSAGYRPPRALSQGFRVVLACCALAGLFFLGKTVVSIVGARQAYREAAQYRQEGECRASDGTAASPSAPCSLETVVVLSKSQHIQRTRHQSRYIYTLGLQRSDGRTVSENQVESALWQSLALGAPVSATVWRDKVVGLAANGHTSGTSDEPDNNVILKIAAIVPWAFGSIFCLSLMRILKRIGTA